MPPELTSPPPRVSVANPRMYVQAICGPKGVEPLRGTTDAPLWDRYAQITARSVVPDGFNIVDVLEPSMRCFSC